MAGQRAKYSPEFKEATVRDAIDISRAVADVVFRRSLCAVSAR